MKKLRQSIRRQDIYWWVNSFLDAAIAKKLDNFPHVTEYIRRGAKSGSLNIL
jgi:trehalose-6-phosphate synthase